MQQLKLDLTTSEQMLELFCPVCLEESEYWEIREFSEKSCVPVYICHQCNFPVFVELLVEFLPKKS